MTWKVRLSSTFDSSSFVVAFAVVIVDIAIVVVDSTIEIFISVRWIEVWNSRRLWKCIDWPHAATVARGDTGDKGKRRWEVAFAFPPTWGNHDSTNESHRIGMSSIRGNRRITDELCGFFGHKSANTMQRKRVVIYFTRVTVFLYGTVDNHAFAICNSRES